MSRLFSYEKEDLKQAVQILKEGGVILYPTDTIWGIGCDAGNEEAVSRIYRIKKRKDSLAMLVLLDTENRLSSYVREIPDIAWDLIEVSEKPITLIYPEAKNLAPNLLPSDGSIGIRITRESFSRDLIRTFGKAIVSTSANISGDPSPAIFDEISDEIKDQVDYCVKYRQDDIQKSVPSSIIKIGLSGEVNVLRP
jgi:L-threonylcarbamoyladenylate synthase